MRKTWGVELEQERLWRLASRLAMTTAAAQSAREVRNIGKLRGISEARGAARARIDPNSRGSLSEDLE